MQILRILKVLIIWYSCLRVCLHLWAVISLDYGLLLLLLVLVKIFIVSIVGASAAWCHWNRHHLGMRHPLVDCLSGWTGKTFCALVARLLDTPTYWNGTIRLHFQILIFNSNLILNFKFIILIIFNILINILLLNI
jgi:hypothetical protein